MFKKHIDNKILGFETMQLAFAASPVSVQKGVLVRISHHDHVSEWTDIIIYPWTLGPES
jgi:hypothetical protein